MDEKNGILLLDLLLGMLDRASSIGNLLANARIEKRDVSEAELDAIVKEDEAARKELDDAISDARAAAKANAPAPSTPPAVGPSTSP